MIIFPPLQFDHLVPPLEYLGSSIFHIYIFVASFDAAYKIENPSMATINRDSYQATTTFSGDIWKMNLYDMYLAERVKEIGIMSNIKFVGY